VNQAKAELEAEAAEARKIVQASVSELASQVVRAVLPATAGGSVESFRLRFALFSTHLFNFSFHRFGGIRGCDAIRAIAQQPAPVAKNSSANANSIAKTIDKSGATEGAGEDENVYRHTPMVRSLARFVSFRR